MPPNSSQHFHGIDHAGQLSDIEEESAEVVQEVPGGFSDFSSFRLLFFQIFTVQVSLLMGAGEAEHSDHDADHQQLKIWIRC